MKVMGAQSYFENNYLKVKKDKIQDYSINSDDKNEVNKKEPFGTKFSQSYLLQRNLLSLKKYPFKNGRISFGKPEKLPRWNGYSPRMDSSLRFISRFNLLKHAKYTDISEMYERDETKRKEELHENKKIRAENFDFLDANGNNTMVTKPFVNYYKELTGFPNLKECSQKIKDEFERTICVAEKNVNEIFKSRVPHAADIIMYGYDDMCSVGLGCAWPGSDLDKAFIIIKGSNSPLKDKEIVNQYCGQIWENMDQRILSTNHYAAFPNVYTKKQVMDNIDLFDSYTKNYTKFDEIIAVMAMDHIKDPIKRAQFNLELSEKLPSNLKEKAKNFAYLIEPIRECSRTVRIAAKKDDKEIMSKIFSSRFCKMSNVAGLRYYHNKQKQSSELKPKLKARKNVEESFKYWDSKKQYNFIKNVIKNMCGDGEPDECFECPDGTRQLMLDDMLTGRIPIEKYPLKLYFLRNIDGTIYNLHT